ncbi:MAG: hypothetical protein PHX38_13850 [Sulfuricella sp.]|nr:hypothetical protein [Sulfuricella sp.]
MFRKQLFYLTSGRLTVYPWIKGRLGAGQAFADDEAGREAFARHLAASPDIPAAILADLVEEDFQRELLPHVSGPARRKMIQRRLGQLYRDTPYRQATVQGREADGRRDDRLLFSALTNAAPLDPWLDALRRQGTPLAGIASPALLSATLVEKLGLRRDHLLLATFQSGGLRQSYFQGGQLKFSRLTPLPDITPDALAAAVIAESDNTRQFLAAARLLPRDAALDVAILAHGEDLRQLRAACRDTSAQTHTCLDLADVARTLKIQPFPDASLGTSPSLSDRLFLNLLGRDISANRYAAPEQTRPFKLRRARVALYALSAAILAGGMGWAGSNGLDALEARRQGHRMAEETLAIREQSQAIVRATPPTAASPQAMKAAVEMARTLAQNAPAPDALLGMVSRALDELPQIRIEQLQWQTSETAGARQPGEAEPVPSARLFGVPTPPWQTLLIEGEVASPRHDDRAALESVSRFAAALGRNPRLTVEITRQPLDVGPAAKLEGRAGDGNAQGKADFVVRLVLRPEN